MIPNKLEDWSLSIIKEIINKGVFENIYFDFKEKLPPSNDIKAKERLRKTICAFANSNGGFLIFGVKDDKGLSLSDRLVGIASNFDFPESFGSLPQLISPFIDWNFKNPAIELNKNGTIYYIHVVRILKNWNSPVSFQDKNTNWVFYKRTNKGNEGMSFNEIRISFLNYYEKSLKLNLLIAELKHIEQVVDEIINQTTPSGQLLDIKISSSTTESALNELYSIIYKDEILLTNLFAIRTSCSKVNSILSNLLTYFVVPRNNYSELIKIANSKIMKEAIQLKPIIIETIDQIKALKEK